MKFCFKLGKFSRFYWLIICSFIFKYLINLLFKLDYQHVTKMDFNNCSLIKEPELNNHTLVYFTYYYFGFFFIGLIYLIIKCCKKNKKNNHQNLNINSSSDKSKSDSSKNNKFLSYMITINPKEKDNSTFKNLILISLIYLISEMIIYYFDLHNSSYISFWVIQIFFIHFFLHKKKKYKLYRHQVLAFSIILIFGFGIKLISSLTPQCKYPFKDPKDVEKIPFLPKDKIEELKQSIISTNEKGDFSCKNAFNIFLVISDKFYSFLIVAIIGYLIGLILHSYFAVCVRDLINEKYVPPISILFFVGIFGFIFNSIALTISSIFPCRTNSNNINKISYICPIPKNITPEGSMDLVYEYYFDNFISYLIKLHDILYPTHDASGEKAKRPIDGILEIIFTIILPILGFVKSYFDFLIIRELSPFHLLLPEVLFQIIKDLHIIIYKSFNHIIDRIQTIQFIFLSTSNFFIIIGLCIYLELIELQFCGFDKDIKNNISIRGIMEMEMEGKEENCIDEIEDGDRILIVKEEDKENNGELKEK